MGNEWRDEVGLWDRINELPPGLAKLVRLAYQAGLEDGIDVAYAMADADQTIAVVTAGTHTELDRRAYRHAVDTSGARTGDLAGCGMTIDATSAEYLARLGSFDDRR